VTIRIISELRTVTNLELTWKRMRGAIFLRILKKKKKTWYSQHILNIGHKEREISRDITSLEVVETHP
jgi:hypothetical protein